MKTKRLVIGVLIILIGLIFSNPTQAGNITVTWKASTDQAVGYKLYWGTSTGNYNNYLDVGNVTQYAISSDFSKGQTFYLSVTAYNANGYESSYSPELIFNFVEDGSSYGNWIVTKGNPPALSFDSGLVQYIVSFGSSTGSAVDYSNISSIPVAAHKLRIKYKITYGSNLPYFVFSLTSTLGARNMIYKFQTGNPTGTSTNITTGLGVISNYAQWYFSLRDLSADLDTAQSGNTIGRFGNAYAYSYLPDSAEIAEILLYSN